MTNVWIFSDLHQDFGGFDLEVPTNADVAIAAGDIQNDDLLVRLGNQLPVVFVAGNHEFYGHAHSERLRRLRELQLSAPFLHVLENEAVTLKGLRFIGTTLWTDYGYNPVAANLARHSMNDHRHIKWSKEPYQRFLPSHATKLHEKAKANLTVLLPSSEPTVVVTHHAPHPSSVHPKYAGDLLNHAYFSDLGSEIEAWKPALWVHGHVHSSFNYRVSETRVICNPHGYPGENPQFDPKLILSIEPSKNPK